MTDSVTELKKHYGVGLTGGIATGKSLVAGILRTAGVLVVDADQLARQVVAPDSEGLAAVVRAFSGAVLDKDGSLDRAALGRLVFADAGQRAALEAIMHPRIAAALEASLRDAGYLTSPRLFVYEAALLVETGHDAAFREVWCTLCPPDIQIQRLMQRDGKSREDAARVIAAQMPAAEKAKRADVVIETGGTRAEVEAQVHAALRRLAV